MAMIQCPSCGNVEDIQAVICSECGAPITALKKCEECGFPLDSDSTFCPECGNPVGNASNAAVFPTVNHTSGVPAPNQQNIYSPPPAAAATITEDPVTAKKRKRFIVYNVIGLLLMIFPTVLFMGKIFVIEYNEKIIAYFSFRQLAELDKILTDHIGSGLVKLINECVNKLFGFDALDAIANIRFIFYSIVLFSAYKFISGWFKVNKGKLPAYAFNVSWIYFGVNLIITYGLNEYVANPIKESLTLSIAFNTTFVGHNLMLGFALLHFIFYAILLFAEGNTVWGRMKNKK